MKVGKKSAIPNSKNGSEVKVKGSKNTRHGSTCKHDVEVSNYIKGIMQKCVESYMGIKHTAEPPQHKEVHKAQKKAKAHIQGGARLNYCYTPV